MPILFRNLTEDQVDSYGLVLISSGISYRVEAEEDRCNIHVADMDRGRALQAVTAYLAENEPPRVSGEILFKEYGRTFSGLWVSALLLVVHVAMGFSQEKPDLIRVYGSAAGPILDGAFYRTLTALLIHSNAVHLLGNMVGVALLGSVVCRIAGPGVGWLMIVVTGAGGNWLNALFYRGQHLSIGASTAVFGAVGILAAYQFLKKLKGGKGLRQSWLPLAAGLALLAFLGAGRETDLMAHLFGFIAGNAVGAVYGLSVRRPAGPITQAGFCIAVAALFVFAWILGPEVSGP